jgi:hypothetical protein
MLPEERMPHKQQRCKDTLAMLSNSERVGTKLQRIAEKARRDSRSKFSSLFDLMDKELLRECFVRLRRDAAAGIDQVTVNLFA